MAGLRPPVAFVFGGGGAWGAVHAGMLRATERAGIRPDLVVGTSVGALNGALVASDPTRGADRLAALWPTMTSASVFPGGLVRGAWTLRSSRNWLFAASGVEAVIRAQVAEDRIEDLGVRFVAVATDFDTGTLVACDQGDLRSALLGSSAIPGVFAPVRRDGRALVDGGLVANVPTGVAAARGAGSLVVFDCGLLGVGQRLSGTIVDVLVRSASIMAAQQLVTDLLACAHLPVVWLSVSTPNRHVQVDFSHTADLIEAGERAADDTLAGLPSGPLAPGLYGGPPSLRANPRLASLLSSDERTRP